MHVLEIVATVVVIGAVIVGAAILFVWWLMSGKDGML